MIKSRNGPAKKIISTPIGERVARLQDGAAFADRRARLRKVRFEFRVGQNFLHQRQTVARATTTASGAQDLYLGMKLGLTEQRGWLPATVLIPQSANMPIRSSASGPEWERKESTFSR
jgi:hypothetical protein